MSLIVLNASRRRKVLSALIADVILTRSQFSPIGGRFGSASIDGDRVLWNIGNSSIGEESLDDNFRLIILALTKHGMAHAPFTIQEVERRPISVIETVPYHAVVVDRDGKGNAHVLRSPANVVDVLLKREFWRVDADHNQAVVFVFLRPSAHIRKLAPPVDAGISPELDENNFSA